MAGTDRKLVYLDTNVILDWVGRSQDREGATDVGGLIRAICTNQMNAVLSQVTRLEILECKNDPTMWKAWLLLQGRKNVDVRGVTLAVMNCAYEIRNHYQALREADPSLKRAPSVPDSLHVATAIVAGATEMFTFDNGKRDTKSVSPLEMGPIVAGKYRLKISRATHDAPGMNV